jgi:hypothetical protein
VPVVFSREELAMSLNVPASVKIIGGNIKMGPESLAWAQAVTFDSSAKSSTLLLDNSATIAWNHTVASDANYLIVALPFHANTTDVAKFATVTFNGDSMTRLGYVSSGLAQCSVFGLANPATGTHSVSVTINITSKTGRFQSLSFKNVGSVGNIATAEVTDATSTTPQELNLIVAQGGIGVDAIFVRQGGVLTIRNGATQTMNDDPGAFGYSAAGYKANATALGWDLATSGSGYVGHVAVALNPNPVGYADFWYNWPWDTSIRPQIDRAASLGMNCIRMIGGQWAVNRGIPQLTLSQYLQRQVQVASYCQQLGLYYYPAEVVDSISQSLVPYTSTVASVIQALQPYSSSIIGFDIQHEANVTGYTGANIIQQLTDLRSAVTALSLTVPYGYTASTKEPLDNSPILNVYGSSSDFLDFHVYPAQNPVKPTQSTIDAGVITNFPTKDIIFGELGDTGLNVAGNHWYRDLLGLHSFSSVAPTASITRVQITEDANEGPTALTANAYLNLLWTHPQIADYSDRSNVSQGSTHYATVSKSDVNLGAITFSGAGMVELCTKLRNDNTAIHLQKTSGAGTVAPTFATRESTIFAGPSLTITTTNGAYQLPCIADLYLNTLSTGCIGNSITAAIGGVSEASIGAALLKFDFKGVTGTITAASLTIYLTSIAANTPMPMVLAANYCETPMIVTSPETQLGGVVAGLRGTMTEAQLAADGSIIHYQPMDTTNPDYWAGYYGAGTPGIPTGFGPNVTEYKAWPELGVKAAKTFGSPLNGPSIISWRKTITPVNQINFNYTVMLDPDIRQGMNETGIKLPGVEGTGFSFSLRMLHGRQSAAHPDMYRLYGYWFIAGDPGGGIFSVAVPMPVCLLAGKKYTIEQHINLNTLTGPTPNADGTIDIYVNGVQVYHKTNCVIRGDSSQIGSIFINIFHGGLNSPTALFHHELGPICWGTQYIGPLRILQHQKGALVSYLRDTTDTSLGVLTSSFSPIDASARDIVQGQAIDIGPFAPKVPTVNPSDGAVYVNPTGSSTKYSGVNIYRNGVKQNQFPLTIGRLADRPFWVTKQAVYQGSVVTTEGVEGPKSAALVLPGRIPGVALRSRVRKSFR